MDKTNLAELIKKAGEKVYQEYAEPEKLKKENATKAPHETKKR